MFGVLQQTKQMYRIYVGFQNTEVKFLHSFVVPFYDERVPFAYDLGVEKATLCLAFWLSRQTVKLFHTIPDNFKKF